MRFRTSPVGQTVLAAFAYLVGTLVLFHPLMRDGGRIMYGEFGDLTATTAYWREVVEHGLNPFAPGRLPDFNAPVGMPIPWTLALIAPVSSSLLWGGTAAFGAENAQSVYLLAGLVLNGIAAFLLVRRITSDAIAGFVAGAILAWFPWAIATGSWQPDFVHAWPFVLLLWRLLVLQEQRSMRAAMLAGLAAAFAMAWTPYYVLFAIVLVAGYVLADAIAGNAPWRRRAAGWLVLLAWIAAVVTAMVLVDRQGESSAVRTYPLSELYQYTTRPSQFLEPHQGIFARLASSVDNGLWSNSSYVGLTVLVLALLAIAGLRGSSEDQRRAIVVCAAVALVAALVAAPPSISMFGREVPMPSRVIYEVAPTWRVLGRLVIVVEVGLAILAGIGLHRLTRNRRAWRRGALAVLMFGIVLGDLWPRPRVYVRLEAPVSVARLATMPPGIVASYPLLPEGQTNMDVRYYQQAMQQQILNGYTAGSEDEARALALTDLASETTLDELWMRDVRYILVAQPSTVALPATGLEHLVTDSRYALYRLTSRRPEPRAVPTSGFGVPEPAVDGTASWWMESDLSTIDVNAPCRCALTLQLHLTSFGEPRRLVVTDGGGEVLHRTLLGTSASQTIDIRLDRHRRQEISLSVDPGPVPIPGPDPRSVALRLDSIQVERRND